MLSNLLLILANYSVLLYCIAGFSAGGVLILTLPLFQLLLSCFNYHYGKSWKQVLMLELNLLISTVVGIFLNGYLYLKYICYDAEGVLVFETELSIGFFLVLMLGFITTLVRFLSEKINSKGSRESNKTDS